MITRWSDTLLPTTRAQGALARSGALRQATVRVTPSNFVRAESDLHFARAARKGLGRLTHARAMPAVGDRRIVRANRDTLESAGVFDLEAGPVEIEIPDPGDRFVSLQVLSQDHYTIDVAHRPTRRQYTKDQAGTRYAYVTFRVFADPRDPADVRAAHAVQDGVRVEQAGVGRFEVPVWDLGSHARVRRAIENLGRTLPDTRRAFGARGVVDPVCHLVGAATAWGASPESEAISMSVTSPENDELPQEITLRDVPVDGPWSVTVYDEVGHIWRNRWDAYAVNSHTAVKQPDGSVVIQFGGCDGRTPNCLPTRAGWTALLRLYRPRPEILNGSWRPPEVRRRGH